MDTKVVAECISNKAHMDNTGNTVDDLALGKMGLAGLSMDIVKPLAHLSPCILDIATHHPVYFFASL